MAGFERNPMPDPISGIRQIREVTATARPLFLYMFARVLPSVATLLFTMIAIHHLTAAEYGVYSLAYLPSMIAATFAGALVSQPILRFGTRFDMWSKKMALKYVPAGLAVSIIPLVWFYEHVNGISGDVLTIAMLIMPLMSLMDTRRNYFISMSRPGSVFLLDAVRSVSSVLCLLLLLKIGWVTAKAPLAAICCGMALCLFAAPSRPKIVDAREAIRLSSKHLLYGFWVGWWLVLMGAFPFFERLLVARHFGNAAAGVYASIADPIIATTSATGSVLVSVLMPKFVKAWDAGDQRGIRRLTGYGVGGIVVSLFFSLVVGLVIMRLFNGHWLGLLRNHESLALVLLLGGGVWQVTVFFHKRLELKVKTIYMLISIMIAMLFFLSITYLVIGVYGLLGVAFAKLMSGWVYMLFVEMFTRRRSM